MLETTVSSSPTLPACVFSDALPDSAISSVSPSTNARPYIGFRKIAGAMAQRGVPVIPLRPRSKVAILTAWPELATTDVAQIEKWHNENPEYNVGAVAKPDGILIWDVDREGVLERMLKETGKTLPETFTVQSRPDSAPYKKHFYFRHTDASRALGNIASSKVGGQFDLKAANGYVVAACSIHPETGQEYKPVSKAKIAPIPDWLVAWLRAERDKQHKATPAATDAPVTIAKGGRNNHLTTVAGALRNKNISREAAEAALLAENTAHCKPPLKRDEVLKILESIWRYEPADPIEIETDLTEATEPNAYEDATVDGDLIGSLTRVLTDGTFIPPCFVRQNIKTVLGAILNRKIGFPNHEDLHLRHFSINISPDPQSGKGESWKRVGEFTTGALNDLFSAEEGISDGVALRDGGSFASGQKLVKELSEHPRILARFEEMNDLFQRFVIQSSTLEDELNKLYESEHTATGSLTNGDFSAPHAELSYIGDFVRDRFFGAFVGRGSASSGFLSRNVLTYAERVPRKGDWKPLDTIAFQKAKAAIRERILDLNRLRAGGHLEGFRTYIIPETEDASRKRLEFQEWVEQQDRRLTARLYDHFKRDVLLRAAFAPEIQITAPLVERAILWAKHQLADRGKLWPPDQGSPFEVMQAACLKGLRISPEQTRSQLQDRCHIYRPGTGGIETYNRVERAMLAGRLMVQARVTQRGSPVFARGPRSN